MKIWAHRVKVNVSILSVCCTNNMRILFKMATGRHLGFSVFHRISETAARRGKLTKFFLQVSININMSVVACVEHLTKDLFVTFIFLKICVHGVKQQLLYCPNEFTIKTKILHFSGNRLDLLVLFFDFGIFFLKNCSLFFLFFFRS